MITWRYFLHFDLIGADEGGATNHPQEEMSKLARELNFKILYSEPVPVGDCWLFLIEANTPWLGNKLPKWIAHQGYPSDMEEVLRS